jgi:hypothetical protein
MRPTLGCSKNCRSIRASSCASASRASTRCGCCASTHRASATAFSTRWAALPVNSAATSTRTYRSSPTADSISLDPRSSARSRNTAKETTRCTTATLAPVDRFGRADVVFCRDVVLHQLDPYGFLSTLLDIAAKALVLRLRTRDVGATVLNAEISCQYHYDRHWVPYIVLNTDELIAASVRTRMWWPSRSAAGMGRSAGTISVTGQRTCTTARPAARRPLCSSSKAMRRATAAPP